MNATYMAGRPWLHVQRAALVLGAAAMALTALAALTNPSQFFHSYLFAFLFWTGVPLGCLAILMLHHIAGGRWGILVRRILESAIRTFPLIALLFLPVLFELPRIYGWAAGVALPPPQDRYFSVDFFLLRSAFYFAIWLGLAFLLVKWSCDQDSHDPAVYARKLRLLSGPGLILYGLTVSFASVDWIMSLEPGWYSSIIGMLVISGQILLALSFVIVILVTIGAYSPIGEVLNSERLHDLGKLLLTFVLLWAYMAFCQFLIIWAENLPEETSFYLHRLTGGWRWVGVGLIAFHFAVPFFLLLSRDLKRSRTPLVLLAVLIVVMRSVDVFWYTAPSFHPDEFHLHWMDVAAPLGIGGLWFAYFSWQLRRIPLLPLGDPRLEEDVPGEGAKEEHA